MLNARLVQSGVVQLAAAAAAATHSKLVNPIRLKLNESNQLEKASEKYNFSLIASLAVLS